MDGPSTFWDRWQAAALEHAVKLMPSASVKPYVKRGKTDADLAPVGWTRVHAALSSACSGVMPSVPMKVRHQPPEV